MTDTIEISKETLQNWERQMELARQRAEEYYTHDEGIDAACREMRAVLDEVEE